MRPFLRITLLLCILISSAAKAGQEVQRFTEAVQTKLSLVANSQELAGGDGSEQIFLIDVLPDGGIAKIKGPEKGLAKLYRVIQIASPLPRPPSNLVKDFESIRLAVTFTVRPDKPGVKQVEVKGAIKYVEF